MDIRSYRRKEEYLMVFACAHEHHVMRTMRTNAYTINKSLLIALERNADGTFNGPSYRDHRVNAQTCGKKKLTLFREMRWANEFFFFFFFLPLSSKLLYERVISSAKLKGLFMIRLRDCLLILFQRTLLLYVCVCWCMSFF